MDNRSIAINGDLGSGKSTVAEELAGRLGIRRINFGAIYRELAAARGMTALQLNVHAHLDDAIDGYIDKLQREIASSGEQVVIDSRLAWHFLSDALKVHLISDPTVAAQRVLSRFSETESYSSLDETRLQLKERSDSERLRFLSRYGVDKNILRNYDLVCDTTALSPGETADEIIGEFSERYSEGVSKGAVPKLLLNPGRIYPTQHIYGLRGLWESDFGAEIGRKKIHEIEPLDIGYADSCYYVLNGHRRLSAVLQSGSRLVSGRLIAEGGEPIVDGITATEYFRSEASLSIIYDWQAAHKTLLAIPEYFRDSGPD